MTDFHLKKAEELVSALDSRQAKILNEFRLNFMRIARKRESVKPALLKDEEIAKLATILGRLDADKLERKIRDAVDSGMIDPIDQKEELKLLENLVRNIPRFVFSLKLATETTERRPLNFVVAFYYRKDDPEFEGTRKKARYHLTIKSYYVVPLIRKVMGENTLAYSATIGDPSIFQFETGIKVPFESFDASFSTGNAKIYLPTDTLDLAKKKQRRGDLTKTLRLVAEKVFTFASSGIRSLVVVVSEEERRKFLEICKAMSIDAMSYGNGIKAKDAAAKFKQGEGMVLVGTAGQYAEGVDLPKGIAPVIFFLRPGYQRPDDPETQFEERRFSKGRCWALWNWRVMIEALQVRGRNIRNSEDIGVCFFISQQFRRFLYPALPEWLKPAYNGRVKFDEAIEETIDFLR